jgi:MinD-like ATPase involved in chromosome partitioning or flagellar assembly
MRVRRARLFVFMGSKGGVGTTTIALNVAAALTLQPAYVLALEVVAATQPPPSSRLARLRFGMVAPHELAAAIENAPEEIDFIVVDAPAWAAETVQAALGPADAITIVVDREPASIEAATRLAAAFRHAASADALGFVLVNRTPLSASPSLGEIRSRLAHVFRGTLPHEADACAAAFSRGLLLSVASPASGLAQAIASLALVLVREGAALPVLAL